jgi:hypothetical protein
MDIRDCDCVRRDCSRAIEAGEPQSQPGDAHEVEADQMARAVMQQEHTPSIDRQVPPQEEEEQQPVAAKRAADFLQRQPEAPTSQEEEEKKKMLNAKLDTATVSRQEDQQAPE